MRVWGPDVHAIEDASALLGKAEGIGEELELGDAYFDGGCSGEESACFVARY